MKAQKYSGFALAFALSASLANAQTPVSSASIEQIQSGKRLFDAAGCANCHTDRSNKGPLLGGGRALSTPFGTFYPPNISPSRENGIGAWSDADFVRALRKGVSPRKQAYFPSFPYRSYTKMTDADILAIKAYIFSLPAVETQNRRHDIAFPFNQRWLVPVWRRLYFTRPTGDVSRDIKVARGPFVADPSQSAEWNRGAYLVEAVAHCTECHTPRDQMGGLKLNFWMGGIRSAAPSANVPNITTARQGGLAEWTKSDWTSFLDSGMTPGGDFVGGEMSEVLTGLGSLDEDDRAAMATYLMSLPAVEAPSATGSHAPVAR